ncbi:MAG TPA: hypothetical protein VFW30_14180, partial [Bryocella sp.]|nr:hypothetical protein [Bryocella sp.]
MSKQLLLLSGVALLCAAQMGYAQVPKADLNREAELRADMATFNPDYRELIAPRRKTLNTLTAE